MTETANSMNILFFDVETTGLKDDKKPAIDPCQPMPFLLGMKLDMPNGREAGAFNVMIKTGEWEISPGAQAIHKITKEMADEYGIHLVTAVENFLDCVEAAQIVVAHNMAFDAVVMQRATYVYHEMMGTKFVDPFEGKTMICTMLAALDIVKAKPKRYGTWKWPKLVECMKHFFNEDLEGAHDALVDVRACARVFYQLRVEGVLE
jgi:DNA polymerase-3 subunit epsilon